MFIVRVAHARTGALALHASAVLELPGSDVERYIHSDSNTLQTADRWNSRTGTKKKLTAGDSSTSEDTYRPSVDMYKCVACYTCERPGVFARTAPCVYNGRMHAHDPARRLLPAGAWPLR